jgi:hypothetical protein
VIKNTGEYQSKLINQYGCDSLINAIVKYKKCNNIYVPNVFSPNGDGVNDRFQIFYEGVNSMIVEIYSRWGE